MVEIDTKITRVTLLRDGARITRTGKASLPAGSQTITVKRITECALSDSFRVSGRGPATIKSLDVKMEWIRAYDEKDISSLQKKLDKLRKKREQIEDAIDILNIKMGGLEATTLEFITTVGPPLAAGKDVQLLTDFYETSDSAYAALQQELIKRNEELEDVVKEIEATEENLREKMEDEESIEVFNVDIQIEMKQQAEVEIQLEYQVSYASWTPAYDINLDEEKAHIKRLAMVSNRTKEDWTDIELIISTASATPVEIIEPEPLFISEGYGIRAGEKREAGMASGGGIGGLMETTAMDTVAKETLAGVAVYELPQKFTIESDSREHPVQLLEEDMDSKTIHYWYADEMAEVVAQNEIKNGDLVILEGKARVFRKGEYIGESYMPMVAPRETVKLGTRAAHDVRAKKKLLKREIEKAGITRGKARREYQYELEVENFSNESIEIEIVDRIPHSTASEIEIELKDKDDLGLEEFRVGIMRWKKTIAPQEKISITYDLEVLWKRDITIDPPLP